MGETNTDGCLVMGPLIPFYRYMAAHVYPLVHPHVVLKRLQSLAQARLRHYA